MYSVIMMEELSSAGASGIGFNLHTDIVANYINNFGNDAQKKQWLPKMATGEMIGAIAMTEPGAGSDLQGVKTSAVRDGDHYILNGSKTFITNGPYADTIIFICKLDDGTDPKHRKVLTFILDRGMPGLTQSRPMRML